MDHSYFRDKVSAFHDRELPAQEQAMLEEHIASCPECQKLLAEFERLDQVVADRIELGGSKDYWERSAQKIEERLGFIETTEITPIIRPSWDKSLIWKLTAVAASVAVLVFIGINKDDIFKQSIPTPEQKQEIRENQTADSVADLRQMTDSVEDKQVTRTILQPPAEKAGGQSLEKTAPLEQGVPKQTAPVSVEERSKVKKINVVEDELGRDARRVQEEQSPAPSVSSPILERESPAVKPTVLSAPALQSEMADMAASTAEAESDSIHAETDLANWRKLRDSLSLALEAPKQSMAEKYGITGYQKSDKSKKAAAASSLRSVDARVETEKQYIEACYQIALLTDDAEEYQSAKQSLEKIAGEVGSANAALAGKYLTRLKTDRPTPPEK
jgi:hypothetical protein